MNALKHSPPALAGLLLAVLLPALSACAQTPAPTPARPVAVNPEDPGETQENRLSAKLLPARDKVLLILGQDLGSVSGYAHSGRYPNPGGVTTYLAFYNLLSSSSPTWGALGEDPYGTPIGYDVDWGAGRLNANSAALAFPGSALVIGLSIAEGNPRFSWARGELANIGRGKHDDKIRRLARFCKDIKTPVYLRIGYEFDGAWNLGYENSEHYINAFRRVVDVMRAEAADNVAFVWQASASPVDDLIDGQRERIGQWYPGDDYVDWMGISWFLPPDERRHEAPTQRELADEVLAFARQRRKPVMIAESAPQRYDLEQLTRANAGPIWDGAAGQSKRYKTADQIWQEWFEPFFEYIRENRDTIRAVAYINADWNSQSMWGPPHTEGYWGDSRVQANPVISSYWARQVADDSFWQHGDPGIRVRLSD